MNPVEVSSGSSPVVLGFPHAGTWLPEFVFDGLNERGRRLADTDWHVDQLYAGLLDGVSSVRATFHRYVIDANRDPDGTSLYPGQNTTELVPLTDFDGQSIWNSHPGTEEIKNRLDQFHAPYHQALESELLQAKERHGYAILFDCHSIRSEIPFLFAGQLPDFNVGTNNGTTCAKEIEKAVFNICNSADGYTSVLNGRFKGGWTTRHYGKPAKDCHAIQLELAQSTYLESEKPQFEFCERKADQVRIHLRAILQKLETILN